MPTQKFCSFCKAFTFTKLDDFDEILWAAAKIGKELKIACPKHISNLKKWMHTTLELSAVPSKAQEPKEDYEIDLSEAILPNGVPLRNLKRKQVPKERNGGKDDSDFLQ